jgi:hypothetical protein
MKSVVIFISLLISTGVFAQNNSGLLLLDAKYLKTVKESIQAGQKEYVKAYEKLLRDAKKSLDVKPVSVIEKKQIPPSGDKKDYMSIGKYWWPDPSKEDGKPYIRKDGEVFPGTYDYPDPANFSVMLSNVETLALAYYFTDNEEYADKAAEFIKTWFLNKETGMNPNLKYAQAIVGKNEGRGTGIIDLHRMPELLDAVILLQGSKNWSREDQADLKKWFSDFLEWLLTSKNGRDEAKAANNHGTWYDVQVSAIAMFTGKADLAKKIISESVEKRIAVQIEPDGKQPLELVRTTSLHYSTFNLEAWFCLAAIAENVGLDVWNYKNEEGRGIKTAFDYLVPFISGKKKWEFKQIKNYEANKDIPLFIKSYSVYKDEHYKKLVEKFKGNDFAKNRVNLLQDIKE